MFVRLSIARAGENFTYINVMVWLRIADVFFLVFHTLLIAFNLVGWAWMRTRRWHLATMLAVAFSWIVLGAIYGTGYCICTDLHWRVREALGTPIRSNSYLQFLFEGLTGRSISTSLLNPVAGAVFSLLLFLSIGLNFRDTRRRRHASCKTEMQ